MFKRLSAAVLAVVMLLSMMCTFVVAHAEGEPMEFTLKMFEDAEAKAQRGDTIVVVLGIKNHAPFAGVEILGEYDRTKLQLMETTTAAAASDVSIEGQSEQQFNYVLGDKILYYRSWANERNMEAQSWNQFTGFSPVTTFNILYLQFKVLDDAAFGETDITFSFKDHCVIYFTEETGNKEQYYEAGTDYVESTTMTLELYCDHDFTDVEYTTPVEGTEMDVAAHSRVCTKCAQTIVEDCAFDEGVVTDPKHTEDGYTTYTCEGCKYEFVVVDDGSATGHEWGNWVHDAELGEEGQHTHTRKCADFESDGGIETKDCTFNDGVYTDPTCLDDGFTTYTCTGCKFAYDVIDEDTATGHNYTNAPYISDENGKHYQECVNGDCNVPNTPVACDYSWNTTAQDHKCDLCEYEVACSWSNWTWNNKDTRAESKHSHVCSVGGDEHSEEAVCNFDDGTVTKPTHTEDGYTTFECQDCASVCVEAGEVALGHTWGNWAHNAELGEQGQHTHTRVCVDNDGGTQNEDCDFNDGVYTDPTCLEDGFTTYTCADCGFAYDVIDEDTATGHTYIYTYSGEGDAHKHTITCEDCDYNNEGNCTFGEWTVAEPATRTETGLDEQFCTDCEHRETKVTPKVAYFELTAPDPEAVAGKEWTVDVAVKNNPGLGGFVLEVAFDGGTMALTDAVKLGEEDVILDFVDNGDGTAKVAYFTESVVEGDGNIITLTFTMSDDAVAGNYDVTVSTSDAVDGTEEVLPFEVESETFTLELIEFLWGDVNDSGDVTLADALYILRYLAQIMTLDEMEQPKAADTNYDDDVTLADALLILRYLAQLFDPQNPNA